MNNQNSPIFFLSLSLNRAIGLNLGIDNFHIITIKKDALVNMLRKRGQSIFCLEEHEENVVIKNSFQLLSHLMVKKFIEENSNGLIPNILTFRSLPQIQKYCNYKEYNYMHSDAYLVRDLEDKVMFYKMLMEKKVPVMECQLKSMESCTWNGKKSVLQLRRGFAGSSTFMINSEKQFLEYQDKYRKHQVKLMPFYKGETITLNGCITDTEKVFGAPFYQITGETKLNSNKLGTSGNSHFLIESLLDEAKEKLYKIIRDIVSVLHEKGYRGYFGLDFLMAEDGEFYPIECNPRLTASVGNYTEYEKKGGRESLLEKHIYHFLSVKENQSRPELVSQDLVKQSRRDSEKRAQEEADLNYSFIIFRNTDEEQKEFIFSYELGRYKNLSNPEFISNDIFLPLEEHEFVLYPAEKGSMIESNKECLYLISDENLYIDGVLDEKILKLAERLFN